MQILEPLLRWIHVLFGVLWVGGLYYYIFVQLQAGKALGQERQREITPEVLPRTIWWGKIAAIWTWITGILLLGLVFHHGQIVYESGHGWGMAGGIVSVLALFGFIVYELLARSALARNGRMFGIVGFVLIGVFVVLMDKWAHFSYRSVNIHLGVLFGTIMLVNSEFRIAGIAKRALLGLKEGKFPDSGHMQEFSARLRHNVYLSIPLLWTMINSHTTALSGGRMGIPNEYAFVILLVVVLIGWHVAFHFFRRSEKVKGQ